jgi:hypothetical protein
MIAEKSTGILVVTHGYVVKVVFVSSPFIYFVMIWLHFHHKEKGYLYQ